MLQRLQDRMALYVHPATSSSGDSGLSVVVGRRSSTRSTTSTTSVAAASADAAELREVVTVFLQPILPADSANLMSSPVPDETLDVLQKIMTIVQSEVDHFGGQLRQFIVDDKGLVIILNWGLRGSTFPNM